MTDRARRGRLLSEAEIALWTAVAQSVVPRPGASLPRGAAPKPEPAATPLPPKPEGAAIPTRPPAAPSGPPPLAPLERRYRQRVARGRIAIDAAIDLHGLTQAEAHLALLGFLQAAHRRGERLVLVVTGKGGRADGGAGVLRRGVPLWLRAAALRPVVLGFEEAATPHGGAGALYVRLRKAGA